MKLTLDIPDEILRESKATAAAQGVSLSEFVTRALIEKLNGDGGASKPWLRSFGRLRHLRSDIAGVNRYIEEECEGIEQESWK